MGSFNMADYIGKPLNCGYYDDTPVDDPWRRLAAEIVIHAVADWRQLIKRGAWLDKDYMQHDYSHGICTFDELRAFFNSGWCAFLMQDFDIEPTRILEILEAELQEAMQKPVKKRRKGRLY